MSSLSMEVTAEVVQAYAEAADDFNPIHFDDAAAADVGLPARIAHGMISGALLSRLLTREYGRQWVRGGSLKVKFVKPVFVGERVTAHASPNAEGLLDVRVDNEAGEPAIVGTAALRP